MLNFAVGPVQSNEEVRRIGYEQVPYFRTPEFSSMMLENEELIKKLAGAGKNFRAVFLTGSGTASMEAAVSHVFSENDRILVINGGSFGERFAELCRIHRIPFSEICLEPGNPLTEEELSPYEGQGYTGFLVNLCETSTGVLYDAKLISDFCKRNGLFLVIDTISSFLADPFHMEALGADVMITGSQKALACPPGVSVLVLSPRALDRIDRHDTVCMYLDLKSALKNGERGQTPFTPAVSILRQIHARLSEIDAMGGVEKETERIAALAKDFRERIAPLPFEMFSKSPSNAVTSLHPLHGLAHNIFMVLKDEYDIWICPNGGSLADTVFRVGHIGALDREDNTRLIEALTDMQKRNLL